MRSEITYDVKLGGRTEHGHDETGRYRVRWVPNRVVRGIAYDTPVPGYRVLTTNLLRLWKAEATESFDFAAFNVGDYYGAVHEKIASETISKVLYPNDEPDAGKQLRLEQQYFFVSCSLQDMLRLHRMRGKAAVGPGLALGRAVERHASVDRHRRVDAAARRRARDGLGRGMDDHRSGRAATPITRCSPKRSRSGPCRSSPRCCRATSKSCSRSTGGSSTRPSRPSRRRRARPARVVDRRGRRAARAHGASGQRRQSRNQRRRGTPHRSAEADRAARLLHDRSPRSSSTSPTASRRGAGWR